MSSKKRDVDVLKVDEPNGKKSRAVADEEAFHSDHELPEESAEEHLSWRNDISFSDWKIVICVTKSCNEINENNERDGESGKEFIYNCHKNILAIGPRRSEYFVRLFENDGTFLESHDNTSRIELHELEAKAFPGFLDYMYKTGEKVEFATDTATALYSLSKYFGARRLQHEVKKFCLRDLRQSDSCGTYYEHAKILQAESLLEATTKYCTRYIRQINEDSHLLHVTDAQFWIDLMESVECQYQNRDYMFQVALNHCSKLILSFCRMHILSPEEFKQLTKGIP
jgi:BTB/POZ domain